MDFKALFNLKDKVVFITGGGRGIGQSLANGFYNSGANVSICDQNEDASVAKNIAGPTISSGSAIRFIGVPLSKSFT